jgi:peptidoglycan LD-endopeptidase LytH
MEKRKYIFLCIFIIAIYQVLMLNFLFHSISLKEIFNNKSLSLDKFRKMEICDILLEELLNQDIAKEEIIENITMNMMLNNFTMREKKDLVAIKNLPWKKLINKEVYKKYFNYYASVFDDLKYFPVPEDTKGGEKVTFENSWLCARNYGGKRGHEGTDIMTTNNQRGYFPIVSITDGIIEQMGWLEQGGYRIGIRSPQGAYFYYAHLHSYAPKLEIGDTLLAGTIIGYMGDSGYSKVEGTVGNFDVHLHLGIYVEGDEGELSINPYWILKYLEKRKTIF